MLSKKKKTMIFCHSIFFFLLLKQSSCKPLTDIFLDEQSSTNKWSVSQINKKKKPSDIAILMSKQQNSASYSVQKRKTLVWTTAVVFNILDSYYNFQQLWLLSYKSFSCFLSKKFKLKKCVYICKNFLEEV